MMTDETHAFLSGLHPYDGLPEDARHALADRLVPLDVAAGAPIYTAGDPLDGLYLILSGTVRVRDAAGADLSLLARGNAFGERGLLRDGTAVTSAEARSDARLLLMPRATFEALRETQPLFRAFFDRGARPEPQAARTDLTRVRVEALMAPDPIACAPATPIAEAARTMRDRQVSCLCICDEGRLAGLVTLRDMVGKALAAGAAPEAPVSTIMTPDPRTLPPSALGSDVLHLIAEHRLGHLPIVAAGRLVGIVTQTDLTRFQSTTSAGLVAEAARASDADALAAVTARIPRMLAQLVAAGHRHDAVTRAITDLADVVTRRLLALAEAALGPAPARYVWAACGSQGRQEQTGLSDQDNVLILEDGVDEAARAYFARLADFVCEGLDAAGYVFCPGDMMARNPRWRMTVSEWRDTFADWIARPSKEAQMLASVMFDLRAVGGDTALFEGLRAQTLKRAAANSIFTAHMASNALSHAPPLGLLRGFATIRSGEHRATIDLKHSGVVPVTDLGRIYALQGRLDPVNTRARLEEAIAGGLVSAGGGRDLLDAYDLIADTRLQHQAGQVRRGARPDNFLPPATLSDFERSHLRDAFVVVKTMQAALMSGRGVLG